jgi:hypothetical protein
MTRYPECHPCVHYRRSEAASGDFSQSCEIGRPHFPTIGPRCAAYCREPGSDDAPQSETSR